VATKYSRQRNMVGKSSRKRMSLADATATLIGREYTLGSCDCFSVIIDYLRLMGVELPEKYHGYTLDTYSELFTSAPAKACEIMVNLMDDILQPIVPGLIRPGDIMLLHLRGKSGNMFLAINGGNGHALFAVRGHPVSLYPARYYRVLKGWRV